LNSQQCWRGLRHPLVEDDVLKRLQTKAERLSKCPYFGAITRLVSPLERADVRARQAGHAREFGNRQVLSRPRLLHDVAEIILKRHGVSSALEFLSFEQELSRAC